MLNSDLRSIQGTIVQSGLPHLVLLISLHNNPS